MPGRTAGPCPRAHLHNRSRDRIPGLSHRRREIWQLWKQGLTQQQMAEALGVTQQAVSYHVCRIVDDLRPRDGDLINPREDGYSSPEEMFKDVSHATVYRPPAKKSTTTTALRQRRIK